MSRKGKKNKVKKQFCIRGHDVFICGRMNNGVCCKCKTEENYDRPKLDRKFCKYGHNILLAGRQSNGRCTSCYIKYNIKYAKEHSEVINKRVKEYKMRNKIRLKNYLRKYNLKKHYNMTLDDWNKMFGDQRGLCLGCLRHQDEFKKVFGVDHDHNCCSGDTSCGKCIRGLLCDGCNNLLGRAKDNVDTLLRLVDYLNKKKFKL